ncbi:major capsid protein [Tenacibaculum maritimum]|nr:major capsid protein [Tenacibaculum maritimum]MDB0613483.1 major capsid protein [Tenacibaculum maritimum]
MVASIFKNLIEKYFGKLSKKITEKVNDKEGEIQYEHKKYLKPDLSTDMKFNSLTSNTSIVAADVVSLDSELSLKARGSYSSATGEIPKLGMIKALNETMLQALKNLKARGNKEAEIVKKLFRDAVDGVKGVHERLDMMFLEALSTGVTLVDENTNTGTGIRVDFGIPDGNRFGATSKVWTNADAKPIDDIENVISKARNKGHVLKYLFIDKITYNAFKNNSQVKEAFAGSKKVNKELIFRISNAELKEFVSEEFELMFVIIDKVCQIQKDGKKKAVEPWKKGNVTFTSTLDLGTLTYGELAEVDHPVDGVEYSSVDNFILVSMFRTNNPLKENTSVQALAIPVLDNVDGIYILDTNESTASADTQTEDDANYSYKGTDYTKASVVAGINAAKAVDTQVAMATIAQKDSTLATKIDSLSEEGIALFEAELVAV